MGQQQQMLLLLVSVIVAFAVLVALAAIDETHTEAGKEAIRQDIVRALGDAQAFYYRPENMGGGGRSFKNLTIHDISLDANSTNGKYSLKTLPQSLSLVGEKTSADVWIEAKAKMNDVGSLEIEWNYDKKNNSNNGTNNKGGKP